MSAVTARYSLVAQMISAALNLEAAVQAEVARRYFPHVSVQCAAVSPGPGDQLTRSMMSQPPYEIPATHPSPFHSQTVAPPAHRETSLHAWPDECSRRPSPDR